MKLSLIDCRASSSLIFLSRDIFSIYAISFSCLILDRPTIFSRISSKLWPPPCSSLSSHTLKIKKLSPMTLLLYIFFNIFCCEPHSPELFSLWFQTLLKIDWYYYPYLFYKIFLFYPFLSFSFFLLLTFLIFELTGKNIFFSFSKWLPVNYILIKMCSNSDNLCLKLL